MSLARRLSFLVALLVGCSSSGAAATSAPDADADQADASVDTGDDSYFALPTSCTRASECASSELCAHPVGGCAAPGYCVTPRAADGGSTSRRLCGCDGSVVDVEAVYPDGYAQVPTRGEGVCPGVPGDGGDAPVCVRGPESGCPSTPCPAGTVCAYEIGGVAGGGGSWCAAIPSACTATPTCACMGLCACGTTHAGWAERCTDQSGGAAIVLACDDGIR
jgi:hypothetical protein